MKQRYYVEDTPIDRALRIGREEGREEARKEKYKEGYSIGLRFGLCSVLSSRFGDIPDTLLTRINEISDAEILDMLIKQASSVTTVTEITFLQKD